MIFSNIKSARSVASQRGFNYTTLQAQQLSLLYFFCNVEKEALNKTLMWVLVTRVIGKLLLQATWKYRSKPIMDTWPLNNMSVRWTLRVQWQTRMSIRSRFRRMRAEEQLCPIWCMCCAKHWESIIAIYRIFKLALKMPKILCKCCPYLDVSTKF